MKILLKFNRRQRMYNTVRNTVLVCAAPLVLCASSAQAIDGGALRVNTYNGWQAFEVISSGQDVPNDGYNHSMPSTFDGAGAWMPDSTTLRVQVNHETSDASISEVDINLANLKTAINNVINTGNTGGVSFVLSARQAYDRWSNDAGASWTNTSSASNTSFYRFCSAQAFAPDTFGQNRGFVDQLYITGEEGSNNRLFVLDSVSRDLYQLSGVVGNATGGLGGMSYDAWENAALVDTGETNHVALLLSPDGGSQTLKLYIGEKGKDEYGNASNSFLARNGLAYGSWYYLISSLPNSVGSSNNGGFNINSSGSLTASKMEDVDTSPSNPAKVVLGNQNYGVFTLDLNLVFGAVFDAVSSSFTITKIANTSGGSGSLNGPDNVDWTAGTTLNGVTYPEGIIFANEDNSDGEIWKMNTDGSNKVLVGETTVGAESTGIFDLSEFVGYAPGSVLISNNQGSPASMSVLINPDATVISYDTTAPTVPTNLVAGNISTSSAQLDWTASTDDTGVAGYKVRRDSVQVAAVTGTTYTDTGLNSNTSYSYTVEAYDAAGNHSGESSPVNITTDNIAPTAAFAYSANLLAVDFTDTSSDSDGNIVSWTWDFGDGNASSAPNPAHSYAAANSFIVSLTVTDDAGATDTTNQLVTVDNTVPEVLTISGLTPDTVTNSSASYSTIFSGTGFAPGASIGFAGGAGPAPSVANIVVVNSQTITATMSIKKGGPNRIRYWDISVTNTDGTSDVLLNGLTVNP